jgi:hypothetical protein
MAEVVREQGGEERVLDLKERRCQETREDCKMRSFINLTLYQTLA